MFCLRKHFFLPQWVEKKVFESKIKALLTADNSLIGTSSSKHNNGSLILWNTEPNSTLESENTLIHSNIYFLTCSFIHLLLLACPSSLPLTDIFDVIVSLQFLALSKFKIWKSKFKMFSYIQSEVSLMRLSSAT